MWGVLWDYLGSEVPIYAPAPPQWWIRKPWGLGEVFFFDRHSAQVLKTRIEKYSRKRSTPSTGTSFFGYGIELATSHEARAVEDAGLRFLWELATHFSPQIDWLVVGPPS